MKRLQRYYRIAGVGYRISLPEDWAYSADGILSPYRVALLQPERTVDFFVVDALTPPSGTLIHQTGYRSCYRHGDGTICYEGSHDAPYMRLLRQGDHTEVQVLRTAIPYGITVNLTLTAMELPSDLIRRGGFLLHASYIRHGEDAILFTAPSGTGKSTQAALWEQLRGAQLINGDRAGVFVEPEGIYARGTPYCGSSGVNRNVRLRIKCIVSLSQAPVTSIVPLAGLQAFRRIWEGCTVNLWNRQEVTACTELVSRVVQSVPIFHLACTPDRTAVEALEQAIEKTVDFSHL